MGRRLEALLEESRREALRGGIPIDLEAYRRAGRDPSEPIACAGNPRAKVCVLGRDLGREEVLHGQPLVGSAGRLVRQAALRAAGREAPPGDELHESALEHVFLANLVPFKPLGNRPFSAAVRERFRPILERLLVDYWSGDRVITLGADAFRWFAPYADRGQVSALWRREDRYRSELRCTLARLGGGKKKTVIVCPLPHPSPANAVWRARLPAMLLDRLGGRLGASSRR